MEKKQRKRRAMTTERARQVKLGGHADEQIFANLINGRLYFGTRKRDVLDKKGNIHSIKSGEKKWQIFLYGKKRFNESIGFLGARIFLKCIDSFPENRKDYLRNKKRYKILLQQPMQKLKRLLSSSNPLFIHSNKIIFLQESIFHNSEVDYLTIKDNNKFHIFDSNEALKIIDGAIVLENSKAIQKEHMPNQKVIFKLKDNGITIGEIEMRNDSDVHYRQIKFWMDKKKTLNLLKNKIPLTKNVSNKIITYGKARRRFKL